MNPLTPQQIREAVLQSPGKRQRDLASELGVSEGQLVAAHCGESSIRLDCSPGDFLLSLKPLGPVMALTRNESAVHEKTGVYDNVHVNRMHSLVLNNDIDLRAFMSHWTHIFSVTLRTEKETKRSFQVYNNRGEAIHKIHLKPQSSVEAFDRITSEFRAEDQSCEFQTAPAEETSAGTADQDIDAVSLRLEWAAMTDVHQFVAILKKLNCSRHQAVKLVGPEFALQLKPSCIPALLEAVVQEETPVMCFVGSRGCIQIHSGPIKNLKEMGPWYNILDPDFNLHLRLDHISEIWMVRKPTDIEYVTSVEVYDQDKNLVVQFFGKRMENKAERRDWREIVNSLPVRQTAMAV